MTRFQILKGEQPKKIDWTPDEALFDKLVFEKGQELKIKLIDDENDKIKTVINYWANKEQFINEFHDCFRKIL